MCGGVGSCESCRGASTDSRTGPETSVITDLEENSCCWDSSGCAAVAITRHGLGDLVGSLNYRSHGRQRKAYFLGAKDDFTSAMLAGLDVQDNLADGLTSLLSDWPSAS